MKIHLVVLHFTVLQDNTIIQLLNATISEDSSRSHRNNTICTFSSQPSSLLLPKAYTKKKLCQVSTVLQPSNYVKCSICIYQQRKKREQKAAGASTSVHSNVIVSSCAPKTKLKHRFDIHFITKQQEYKTKKRIDVTIETNEASLNKRKQNK